MSLNDDLENALISAMGKNSLLIAKWPVDDKNVVIDPEGYWTLVSKNNQLSTALAQLDKISPADVAIISDIKNSSQKITDAVNEAINNINDVAVVIDKAAKLIKLAAKILLWFK
ncbi:hypothetical protein [Yersinia hibernica]|uniref:Uncharacterized protein n=1 Tax=Yersinia enterocolitica LC20 TaxID=1443113 RepID=A0A7U4K2K1_YEREN|nr:hypothetical protein [Yersinia hibernica]AHM75597.1 hypothetical protein LC20_04344 [Yersinia hibernica]